MGWRARRSTARQRFDVVGPVGTDEAEAGIVTVVDEQHVVGRPTTSKFKYSAMSASW